MSKGKRFVATDEQRAIVKNMVCVGVTQDIIAKSLGISQSTLVRHFREELDHGLAEANAAVVNALFERATKGGPSDVTAMIFWLKSRAGFREARGEEPGKKETRQKEAEEIAATGNFAPRETPLKLVK